MTRMPFAVSYKIDKEYMKQAVIDEFNNNSEFSILSTMGEFFKISNAIARTIITICSLIEMSI